MPPGEIGNLLIAGDSTCACYWNKHEKTRETIEGRGFGRATSITRTPTLLLVRWPLG